MAPAVVRAHITGRARVQPASAVGNEKHKDGASPREREPSRTHEMTIKPKIQFRLKEINATARVVACRAWRLFFQMGRHGDGLHAISAQWAGSFGLPGVPAMSVAKRSRYKIRG